MTDERKENSYSDLQFVNNYTSIKGCVSAIKRGRIFSVSNKRELMLK